MTNILYELANAKAASCFKLMQYLPVNSVKWKRINFKRASASITLGSIPELIPSLAKGLDYYRPNLENAPLIETLGTLMYVLGFELSLLDMRCILFHLHALPPSKRFHIHIVLRTILKVLFASAEKKKGLGFLDAEAVKLALESWRCGITLWPCNRHLIWSEEEFIRSMLLQLTETIPLSPPSLIDQATSGIGF